MILNYSIYLLNLPTNLIFKFEAAQKSITKKWLYTNEFYSFLISLISLVLNESVKLKNKKQK